MGPLKRMALKMALATLARLFSGEMPRERALGVVRHALTTLGGFLVARGVIDASLVEPMVGAGLTAFGMIWSVIAKRGASAA